MRAVRLKAKLLSSSGSNLFPVSAVNISWAAIQRLAGRDPPRPITDEVEF